MKLKNSFQYFLNYVKFQLLTAFFSRVSVFALVIQLLRISLDLYRLKNIVSNES